MAADRQDDTEPDDSGVVVPPNSPVDPAATPPVALLDAARRTVPGWLQAAIAELATRHGLPGPDVDGDLRRVVDEAVSACLDDLDALLGRDVDDQRSNPLSVLRAAVTAPSRALVERGARPSSPDAFRHDRFPDDPFGIGPATWSDVSPDLHEPGLAWGAWKALTVLRRRRDEGLR